MVETTTVTDEASDQVDEADYSGKWAAFAAIAISFVTMVMTMSMVFVALSSIADDFGVTLRAVSWVVIAESLVISALLLPFGRLADMIGRKKLHLIGLVIFASGAVLTALAPTFPLLIVARVVMATGNAMGQSVGTAMVVSIFPASERGKAIGSQTTAVSIGGASGPIFAGLLLQFLPWEALFFLLVIPISIAFVAALFVLDEDRVNRDRNRGPNKPFDWAGAALSGVAVSVIVLTINNPVGVPWASPLIVGGGVLAVTLLVAFGRWELSRPDPMLELRMFASRTFSFAVTTRLLGFMAATINRFLLPVFLISLRGMAEGAAGLILFLVSLGMGMAAQTSGRLSDRLGARPFTVSGLLTLAVVGLVMGTMTAETPLPVLAGAVLIYGLASGTWNVPNNSTILGSVAPSQLGVVGAFTNLTRNLGNVFGQAVSSAVVVGVMVSQGFDVPLSDIADSAGASAAFVDGWLAAHVVLFAMALIAAVLAFFTRPEFDGKATVPVAATVVGSSGPPGPSAAH